MKPKKILNNEVNDIFLNELEKERFWNVLQNQSEPNAKLKQAMQKFIVESIEKSVKKADSKKAKFIKHEEVSAWFK